MSAQLANLGLRALTLSVKFVFIIALAATLPPEQVGIYGLITVTVSYSIYILGLEFHTFSAREISDQPKSKWPNILINQGLFFSFTYPIALSLIYILFFVKVLPGDIMFGFFLITILEHLSSELVKLLVVLEKQLLSTTIIFTKQALWPLFFILWSWVEPNKANISTLITFWIYGTLASIAIGVVPLLKLDWKETPVKIDIIWIKRGIIVATPLLLSTLATRSLFTLDRYAFETLNGLTLLGAYSVYFGIASAIISFMESGVFVFYYPKMIKAYKTRERLEFLTISEQLVKQSAIWLTLLTIGAITFGTIAFQFFQNKIYNENIGLFIGITISVFIYSIGYIFQYGLYALHKDKIIIYSNTLGLAIGTVTFLLLSRYTDYWAVTIAILLANSSTTFVKAKEWYRAKTEFVGTSKSHHYTT